MLYAPFIEPELWQEQLLSTKSPSPSASPLRSTSGSARPHGIRRPGDRMERNEVMNGSQTKSWAQSYLQTDRDSGKPEVAGPAFLSADPAAASGADDSSAPGRVTGRRRGGAGRRTLKPPQGLPTPRPVSVADTRELSPAGIVLMVPDCGEALTVGSQKWSRLARSPGSRL